MHTVNKTLAARMYLRRRQNVTNSTSRCVASLCANDLGKPGYVWDVVRKSCILINIGVHVI